MKSRASTLGTRLGSVALRYGTPLVGAQPRRITRRLFECKALPASGVAPSGDDLQAKLARVEAALFLSREPLATRKLAILAKLADGTEARTVVKLLAQRYDDRASAMQVVEIAGGVQLFTRPVVADWVRRLHGESEEVRLSPPAMETLAVVAYRQPVVRAEVEAIRGVQCGEILRVLMERDLLRIVGRSEELGRPFLYGTTKKFLQVFGLRRLEQLPPIDQIHSVGADW
jgi:segregation and condensation protein B